MVTAVLKSEGDAWRDTPKPNISTSNDFLMEKWFQQNARTHFRESVNDLFFHPHYFVWEKAPVLMQSHQ